MSGRVCKSRTGQPLNYRRTSLSLKLFHTGTVAVYVIDNAGDTVANISAGRYLQRFQPAVFFWKGFENGGRIAPDGTYSSSSCWSSRDARSTSRSIRSP